MRREWKISLVLVFVLFLSFGLAEEVYASDISKTGLNDIIFMWKHSNGNIRAIDRFGAVAEFDYLQWTVIDNGVGSSIYSYYCNIDTKYGMVKIGRYLYDINTGGTAPNIDAFFEDSIRCNNTFYRVSNDAEGVRLWEWYNGQWTLVKTLSEYVGGDSQVVLSYDDYTRNMGVSYIGNDNLGGRNLFVINMDTFNVVKIKLDYFSRALGINYYDRNCYGNHSICSIDGTTLVTEHNGKDVLNSTGITSLLNIVYEDNTMGLYCKSTRILSHNKSLGLRCACKDKYGNILVGSSSGYVYVVKSDGTIEIDSNFYTDYQLAEAKTAAKAAETAAGLAKTAAQNTEKLATVPLIKSIEVNSGILELVLSGGVKEDTTASLMFIAQNSQKDTGYSNLQYRIVKIISGWGESELVGWTNYSPYWEAGGLIGTYKNVKVAKGINNYRVYVKNKVSGVESVASTTLIAGTQAEVEGYLKEYHGDLYIKSSTAATKSTDTYTKITNTTYGLEALKGLINAVNEVAEDAKKNAVWAYDATYSATDSKSAIGVLTHETKGLEKTYDKADAAKTAADSAKTAAGGAKTAADNAKASADSAVSLVNVPVIKAFKVNDGNLEHLGYGNISANILAQNNANDNGYDKLEFKIVDVWPDGMDENILLNWTNYSSGLTGAGDFSVFTLDISDGGLRYLKVYVRNTDSGATAVATTELIIGTASEIESGREQYYGDLYTKSKSTAIDTSTTLSAVKSGNNTALSKATEAANWATTAATQATSAANLSNKPVITSFIVNNGALETSFDSLVSGTITVGINAQNNSVNAGTNKLQYRIVRIDPSTGAYVEMQEFTGTRPTSITLSSTKSLNAGLNTIRIFVRNTDSGAISEAEAYLIAGTSANKEAGRTSHYGDLYTKSKSAASDADLAKKAVTDGTDTALGKATEAVNATKSGDKTAISVLTDKTQGLVATYGKAKDAVTQLTSTNAGTVRTDLTSTLTNSQTKDDKDGNAVKSAAVLAKEARDKVTNLEAAIDQKIPPVVTSVKGHNGATCTSRTSIDIVINASGAKRYRIKANSGSWSNWYASNILTATSLAQGANTIYVEASNSEDPVNKPGAIASGSTLIFKI